MQCVIKACLFSVCHDHRYNAQLLSAKQKNTHILFMFQAIEYLLLSAFSNNNEYPFQDEKCET